MVGKKAILLVRHKQALCMFTFSLPNHFSLEFTAISRITMAFAKKKNMAEILFKRTRLLTIKYIFLESNEWNGALEQVFLTYTDPKLFERVLNAMHSQCTTH